jgi:hypothetical protein
MSSKVQESNDIIGQGDSRGGGLLDLSNRSRTVAYFGNGCFWERQKAYADVEMDETGPFKRSMGEVTSVVGYAGGSGQSTNGQVCYHHSGGNQDSDYGHLGHCEVVAVAFENDDQFQALIADYFSSFTQTGAGMQRSVSACERTMLIGLIRNNVDYRPDPMDRGGEYRNVIGIPGGTKGSLYGLVTAANVHGMALDEGTGDEDDVLNHVYIMNSETFEFHRGEQYHQVRVLSLSFSLALSFSSLLNFVSFMLSSFSLRSSIPISSALVTQAVTLTSSARHSFN